MRKIFQPSVFAASLLLMSLPGAHAQGAGPQAADGATEAVKAPVSKTWTMEAYGRKYPYCREWTDNCQICLSGEDGRIVCSTVAIACVQKAISCTALRWPLPGKNGAGAEGAGTQ